MTRDCTSPTHPVTEDAWEGLTLGTLSKDEEAVLRALAEDSEVDAARFDAHAPLDESFRARVTERVSARLHAGQKVRTRRVWIASALSVAAAAAAILLWTPPDQTPRYLLRVQGGDAVMRGAHVAASTVAVSPDSMLTLIAEPERRVTEKVTANLFVLSNERAKRLEASAEVADTGAIRVRVPGALLPFDARGALTLALIISEDPLSSAQAQELVQRGGPDVLLTHVTRSDR